MSIDFMDIGEDVEISNKEKIEKQLDRAGFMLVLEHSSVFLVSVLMVRIIGGRRCLMNDGL